MILHGAMFPAMQTRDVIQPDSPNDPKWIAAPVTKYKLPLKWRKVYEVNLEDVDSFLAWSMLTSSTKHTAVYDAHGKVVKYISCMPRTALVVSPQPLPLISEQAEVPGTLVACDSGTNSWQWNNVTPYVQPPRDNAMQVSYKGGTVTLVISMTSNDALPDTYFEVFGSSKGYGHVTVLPFYPIDGDYIRGQLGGRL